MMMRVLGSSKVLKKILLQSQETSLLRYRKDELLDSSLRKWAATIFQSTRQSTSSVGGRLEGLQMNSPPGFLPYEVRGLNHIAIAVPDLTAAAEHYKTAFGAQISEPLEQPAHGVTVVFVRLNNACIELLHPLGDESPVAAFLQRNPRGGLHHLCFTVDNISAASSHVKSEGVHIIGSEEPRIGAHGKPVVFLDPRDNHGVLMELEEASNEKGEKTLTADAVAASA